MKSKSTEIFLLDLTSLMCYLGSRGAIIILNNLVVDGGTHTDSSAREVRVEVLAFSENK